MTSDKASELMQSVDANIQSLAAMTDEARASDSFKAYLRTMARFHNYSWTNQWLIAIQRPGATQVAGFHTWKQIGRNVKKGAKGIGILAPMTGKRTDESTGEKVPCVFGFRSVYVFDAADTEGKELPEHPEYRVSGDGQVILEQLLDVARKLGIAVTFEEIINGARGYSAGGKIVIGIGDDVTSLMQAGTLAHELAHECLHWDLTQKGKRALNPKPSAQKELEAESVSYVVMQWFGVEQPSQFYLAGWGATSDGIKDSLSTIRNAAKRILDALTVGELEEAELATAA